MGERLRGQAGSPEVVAKGERVGWGGRRVGRHISGERGGRLSNDWVEIGAYLRYEEVFVAGRISFND